MSLSFSITPTTTTIPAETQALHLDCDAKAELTSPALLSLLSLAPPTTTALDLSETECLDAATLLPSLPPLLPHLSNLSLAWTNAWMEEEHAHLLASCLSSLPCLTILDLSVVPAVTDGVLVALSSPRHALLLKHLNIGGCRSLSLAGVAALLVSAPALESLVWGDPDDDEDHVKCRFVEQVMDARNTGWSSLDLSRLGDSLTPDVLSPILSSPVVVSNLVELSLAGSRCGSDDGAPGCAALEEGPPFPSLRSVDVDDSELLPSSLAALVGRAPGLEVLEGGCGVDDEVIDRLISCCPSLSRLSLPRSDGVSVLGLARLHSLPCLEHLDLSHTVCDDDVLSSFSSLSNLTSLHLSGCQNVSDTGVAFLPPQLDILDLSDCTSVTSINALSPSGSTGFHVLDVGGTSVDDLDALVIPAPASGDNNLFVVVTPPSHPIAHNDPFS